MLRPAAPKKSSLLSDIVAEAYHNGCMTIDGLSEAFLEMLAAERGAAPNTLAAYRADLEDFAGFLGARGITSAGAGEIGAYLAGLQQSGLAARTQARRLSAIRQFYLFLCREGLREDNPATGVATPGLPQSLPKYLSETEVDRLLEAARAHPGVPGAKAHAGLEILYATGLRVSELLALPARALATDATVLMIRGKGGRDRIVPLSDAAKAAALRLRDTYAEQAAGKQPKPEPPRYLFAGRDAREAMTRQGFALLLKQIALAANIDPARLSPHVLRHSFASHLLAHGADLRSLQKLLGHAEIATTQIYTHVLAERLQRLVEAHHPLAKGR
jgi:integrase/recombinase XerD